jgi:hypothetical protein
MAVGQSLGNSDIEIGTFDIGIPFMIMVAVPFHVHPFRTDTLKSFIVCMWDSLPFSLIIWKVELNTGGFVLHIPEIPIA